MSLKKFNIQINLVMNQMKTVDTIIIIRKNNITKLQNKILIIRMIFQIINWINRKNSQLKVFSNYLEKTDAYPKNNYKNRKYQDNNNKPYHEYKQNRQKVYQNQNTTTERPVESNHINNEPKTINEKNENQFQQQTGKITIGSQSTPNSIPQNIVNVQNVPDFHNKQNQFNYQNNNKNQYFVRDVNQAPQNPHMINNFNQQNFNNQQNYQINLNLQQKFITSQINNINFQNPTIQSFVNENKPNDISKITGSLNIQATEFIPKKKLSQEMSKKIQPQITNPPVQNNISFSFYDNQVENVIIFNFRFIVDQIKSK